MHAEAADYLDHVKFFVEVVVARLYYLRVEGSLGVDSLAEAHNQLLTEVLEVGELG